MCSFLLVSEWKTFYLRRGLLIIYPRFLLGRQIHTIKHNCKDLALAKIEPECSLSDYNGECMFENVNTGLALAY